MHSNIKVTDLNLRQWDYLTTKVPVTGRTFLPGLPRVCVEFQLTPDLTSLHIEMDVAEFAGLTCVLEGIKNETIAVAQAALTPDAIPDFDSIYGPSVGSQGDLVLADGETGGGCTEVSCPDSVEFDIGPEDKGDALPDSVPKTPFDDLDRLATPGFFADSGLPDAQIRSTAEMDWDESR